MTKPISIAKKSWLPAECISRIADIEKLLVPNDLGAVEARLMALIDDHERHLDRESLGLNAGTNVMNPRAAALCPAPSATGPASDIPATSTRWAWNMPRRSRSSPRIW